MPFPSKLPFHALLQYSPRGTSKVSVQSRDVCYGIKDDKYYRQKKQQYIDYFAQGLHDNLERLPSLQVCFGPDVQLIPVPRSAPMQKGSLWPSERICEALIDNGLADNYSPSIERLQRIRRSASSAGNRPNPTEHYKTLGLTTSLLPTSNTITVVDDVVTRGSTFVAIDRLLREKYPNATIHYFAMVRTVSDGELDKVIQAVEGTITFSPPYNLLRTP